MFATCERVDEYDTFSRMMEMRAEFEQECAKICPNRSALCDIVLDICYKKSATKRFAWEMCGDDIIQNLLSRNGGVISYPVLEPDGEVCFGGNRFSVKQTKIGGEI